MKRFASFLLVLALLFCSTTVAYAEFVDYGYQNPEDPYAPAPMIFDYPSLLSYYYYPDQTARPNLYVYGGTYWGLTNTSSWEHSEHTGRDYVSWATYKVNYQLYLNDGTESNTPWKMNKVRLQLKSPRSGTQIRVNGFSDNINLAVQGTTDSYTTLTVDAYPVNTLFIPQDSNTRFSFWIEFTVMFNPSIDIEDLYNLSAEDSPVQPIMDATGFQPQLVSYIPADSMGGSSAAGQQQIDQSINAGITQDQQQYQDTQNQFQQATNSGQAELTNQFDTVAGDLHSYEEQIFQDIDDYKVQLNFSLNTWSEVQDGLGYVRKIFMIIWDNSPTQIVTLSLMLGLAMYLLGRGAVFERAARRSRRGGEE